MIVGETVWDFTLFCPATFIDLLQDTVVKILAAVVSYSLFKRDCLHVLQ